MWTDYALKFENETEWQALAPQGEDFAVDVIGKIVHEDGTEIPGFHVNLRARAELPEGLKPYVIPAPEHPKRVWA